MGLLDESDFVRCPAAECIDLFDGPFHVAFLPRVSHWLSAFKRAYVQIVWLNGQVPLNDSMEYVVGEANLTTTLEELRAALRVEEALGKALINEYSRVDLRKNTTKRKLTPL